ncbi:hypothetical protein AGMMS49545_19550 [Betaproteobacteria bacterium]|nr:hypothetical protein AGMMS49545_19550 [Betaproteobacteria bacterium]GHU43212.1 hypothetical protein AGMMS50289_09230 [Betaproteobacteria bacterium]
MPADVVDVVVIAVNFGCSPPGRRTGRLTAGNFPRQTHIVLIRQQIRRGFWTGEKTRAGNIAQQKIAHRIMPPCEQRQEGMGI